MKIGQNSIYVLFAQSPLIISSNRIEQIAVESSCLELYRKFHKSWGYRGFKIADSKCLKNIFQGKMISVDDHGKVQDEQLWES